jgi:hypothetical protein
MYGHFNFKVTEKNKLTVSAHFSRTPPDFSHTPLEIFDIVREIAAPLT